MMDESAVEVVKDYARRHAEARLVRALDAIKATGGRAGGYVHGICSPECRS